MNIPIIHNDHAYVDLGLFVNWATSNIGAIYPEHAGHYFSKDDLHASPLDGRHFHCTYGDYNGGTW